MARNPLISGADLEREVLRLVSDRVPPNAWPVLRTFESFATQYRAVEAEAWELQDAPADEVAAVVRAHRAALDDPLWFRRWPSRAEAEWIARLTQAAPDIDPALAYHLAVRASRDPESHRDIVAVLAFAPWKDDGKALLAAVREGRVSEEVAHLARV